MDFQKTQIQPLPGVFDDGVSLYLDQRWIDELAARKLRISGIGGYVWFPYEMPDGISRWKARSVTDKKEQFWTKLPDAQKEAWKAPFFNQQEPYDTKYLIITEGEFDCVALCQLGATNCVSLPNGSSSVEATFKNNYRFLQKFDSIYIAFDMDEPGETAAKKAIELLPKGKVLRLNFPKGETNPKDANQWLIDTNAQPEDLARLMLSSTRPYCERLKDAAYFDDSIFNAIDPGASTGWDSLDKILGGVRKKELTIICAETGCGKTTFCINLAANLANSNHTVWINSFEMSENVIHRKLASVVLKKRLKLRELTHSERIDYRKWCLTHKVFINPLNTGSWVHDLRKDIEVAVIAFGVEFIFLDHFDYIHKKGKNKLELENINEAIMELHVMAMEFNVGIILVAHPGQVKFVNGKRRELRKEDVKGSSAINQYSDNCIIITRLDRMDETNLMNKNKVQVRVDKNRVIGTEWFTNLQYNPMTDSYSEITEITPINKGLAYADN